ncbi:Arc family DNA-binding protein [Mesorhizobium sp. L2C066B000]|uniref:Arc family DNA-binding protein n=1 Tax=Mesorhizobium sp. L2C066B000 TaxID=1287105 RepID=UPI0003D03124|nr:Arc family DNA-binding protein [Mesorhizobium sp. L2C066B000]ESZ32629.1 DNA-binding protein [Mesorhizobium sp. L2C066B000]
MPDQTEPPSFHVRLSATLRKRLKVAAAENGRSLNQELVTRLEQSFELSDSERATLQALLAKAQSVLDLS